MSLFTTAMETVRELQPRRIIGRVRSLRGLTLLVDQLRVPIGSIVCVETTSQQSPSVRGEVVGFQGDAAIVMLYDDAGGIAQALSLCERFVGTSNVAVCLGDNIFDDEITNYDLEDFDGGARIFLKEVSDPERFGVATVRKGTRCDVMSIEEKPKKPKSNLCVTGLYVYDSTVFSYIKGLTPSDRGELEITDVNNFYVKDRLMSCHFLGSWWSDAGTFESLLKASSLVANKKLCTCQTKKIEPLPSIIKVSDMLKSQ